ncbi:unnamed protein product, partial [Rotaria sp. Silwood2]
MDNDPDPDTTDDDRDDRGHSGFLPGAGRKRKQSAASIQNMSQKRCKGAAQRQATSR